MNYFYVKNDEVLLCKKVNYASIIAGNRANKGLSIDIFVFPTIICSKMISYAFCTAKLSTHHIDC